MMVKKCCVSSPLDECKARQKPVSRVAYFGKKSPLLC